MLQTLFYIPMQVGGLPVFGFGLLLAAWTAFGAVLLIWLVRRQGLVADTLGYVPLLVIVAAVIVWVLPGICQPPFGLPIRGYGMMILLAVAAGTALAVWRGRRAGVDPEVIFSLAFWMILPAIVGARAFYVAEYWSEQYWPVYPEKGLAALLLAVVNVTKGGLVIYGGFLGGVLGMVAFFAKFRLPLLATADLVAPSLMLGLAIGRIGCFLNGCCYGGLCDLPWAVSFPAGSPPYVSQVTRGVMDGLVLSGDPKAPAVVRTVLPHSPAEFAGLRPGDRLRKVDGYDVQTARQANRILNSPEVFHLLVDEHKPLALEFESGRVLRLSTGMPPGHSRPVHPTQLYSSIGAFLIFLLLLAYDPYRRRDGELWTLMLTVYPISRFLEEMIRTDEPAIWGTGMTVSQNISLALLLCAGALWAYVLLQPKRSSQGDRRPPYPSEGV